MGTLTYIKNLLKDKNIASVTPTSQVGVKRVCEKIDFTRPKILVEYGPGTGVFPQYILTQLTPDSRLILIEQNQNFVEILKNNKDPRVSIRHDNAQNVLEILSQEGVDQVDAILSGIPFSLFSPELREDILTKTHRALKPGGQFLAYQTFFQADHHLQDYLEKLFSRVVSEYEIRNVPPMRIYEAVK